MKTRYSKEAYERVWDNCFPTRDNQIDAFDREICFDQYGQKTEQGWEIDHIWPLNPKKDEDNEEDKNPIPGANTFRNVQPLHFKSNEEKSNLLHGEVNKQKFIVSAIGDFNNRKEGIMRVKGLKKYSYDRWQ